MEPCLCPRDPFMSVPYCPSSHTTRRPRMLHMHACIVHRLHRLIPTAHEAMTFGERKGWLPFALLSLLLRPTACCRKHYRCDCGRSSSPSPVSISPNFLSKHLPWLSYREGQLYAQPQPQSTPGPSSLLSIDFCLDPWLLSDGTCIGFVALDTT